MALWAILGVIFHTMKYTIKYKRGRNPGGENYVNVCKRDHRFDFYLHSIPTALM